VTTGGPVDLVALYLLELVKVEGYPYCWPVPENNFSGKGLPGSKFLNTRDCSGTVTAAILAAGGPDLRAEWNADRMWREWMPTDKPEPGDLAFYGALRISHVMSLMPDGRVFGACGGDSRTVSPAIAAETGACVKYRSAPGYRRDFAGFRVNPLRSIR
jgi:hypothetical protein